MDPLKVLKAAIQAVPAMKYALGVAGIGAVVAIVLSFNNGPQSVVFGGLIVVGLMFILVVFSRYATAMSEGNVNASLGPATVLIWFYTIAIMVATTLYGWSVFAKILNKTPPPDLTRVKFFGGPWTYEKIETVTWAAGACATSDVSVTTKARLNLDHLNDDTGVYSGNYTHEYSGKVVRDGTPNHDCRYYQTGRPDYHYKMFRNASARCSEQGRCFIDLGEVTCEGDCSEAKNLSFTSTMVVPDASRSSNSFDAINGDGTSITLSKQ